MGFFHTHNWKEVARTYSPPVSRGMSGYIPNMDELLMGVTTILWECKDKDCQELRKEKMLGKEWVTTK